MKHWGFLIALPVVALAAALLIGPTPQPQDYHAFADGRSFYGIPNFGNVVSNLAFVLFGAIGLRRCLRQRPDGALSAWTFLFLAFVLVGFGSAYYHRAPDDSTLVMDRLAMTLGFTGLYVAILTEYVDERLERALLLPVALAGLASVLYWDWAGDLAPYFAFQGTAIASAVIVLALYESLYPQKRFIIWALVLYAGAVACEQLDHRIFAWTRGVTGGHAVKHLLAALAAVPLAAMLARRPPIPDATAVEEAMEEAGEGATARTGSRKD